MDAAFRVVQQFLELKKKCSEIESQGAQQRQQQQQEEDDEDDLLSSIHSVENGQASDGKSRLRRLTRVDDQGFKNTLSSVRQYQFMRNDREEENYLKDLHSALITNLE